MTAAITPSYGAPHGRILSVGAYRPERIVTNAEICERIDSSDEWIRERSGIIERRWAAPEESVVDMATAACMEALAGAGIAADEIGMVLVASVTHPYQTPSAAAEVSARLGATNAAAMDIAAACAGFCYGLSLANDMVRGGSARYVLVVGVEKLTDWVDPDDRSTAFIFADGAGAAVVGPSEAAGIGPVVWGSDGTQYDVISQKTSWREATDAGAWPHLRMDGNPVFRWASFEMAKVAQQAMDAAGVTAEDLDVFVPHQANMRITDAMFRALKLPDRVVVARDIAHQGNTSAASIPLAIEALTESGAARSGDTALIIGFGAGLVYAGQVITLP